MTRSDDRAEWLPILLQPIQDHLAALERQPEARIVAVNQRIAAGENPTSRSNAAASAPAGRSSIPAAVRAPIIQSSIPCARWILAACCISSIRTCPFMACFEHVLGRYVNSGGRRACHPSLFW